MTAPSSSGGTSEQVSESKSDWTRNFFIKKWFFVLGRILNFTIYKSQFKHFSFFRNFESTSRLFLHPSNRASPPDYYQLTLKKEEEDRHREDLFSLIYSPPPPITPPTHPPPSVPSAVPSTSSDSRLETLWSEKPKLRRFEKSKLNNNLSPSTATAFRHHRAVSTDSTFAAPPHRPPQKQEAFDVDGFEENISENDGFPSDTDTTNEGNKKKGWFWIVEW